MPEKIDNFPMVNGDSIYVSDDDLIVIVEGGVAYKYAFDEPLPLCVAPGAPGNGSEGR